MQNLIGGADDAGCERATEVEPQRISNCRSSSTLFKDPPWSRPREYILGISSRFSPAHASHKYWGRAPMDQPPNDIPLDHNCLDIQGIHSCRGMNLALGSEPCCNEHNSSNM